MISTFAQAIGRDLKGKVPPVLYAAGIALAFVDPWAAGAMYLLVRLMWLIPDRRIERKVQCALMRVAMIFPMGPCTARPDYA